MFVRTTYAISGLELDQLPGPLVIRGVASLKAKVRLQRRDAPREFGGHRYDVVATATAQVDAPRKIAAVLATLSGDHALPDNAQQFFVPLCRNLDEILFRTVRMLMWRSGIGDVRSRFLFEGGTCSANGRVWLGINGLIHLAITAGLPRPKHAFERDVVRDARVRVKVGDDEPLGRQLLREAWELRERSPRGALILAIAGAEVGVKGYVARLMPDASWLLENLPSPPLYKMLRDYLPALPVAIWFTDRTRQLPDDLLREIRTGVELRNKIVHKGSDVPSETLDRVLRAVSDVLWVLDVCQGAEWAARFIRAETLLAWASSPAQPLRQAHGDR